MYNYYLLSRDAGRAVVNETSHSLAPCLSERLKRLSLFLVAFLFAVNAAAYDFVVDGIYYSYGSGSTCSVTSGDEKYTGVVNIPANVTYNGQTLTVTEIGMSAFNNCSSLIEVTIPNSVTSIDSLTFYRCINLAKVTIPNSVTEIGYEAFYCCSSLTELTIPNSVTTIGRDAFGFCSSLAEVTIGNSVTLIDGYAFQYCSSLTELIIPNSVISIEEKAFMGCSSLVELTISNSVEYIGERCFSICSSLENFTFGTGLASIGRNAFSGCTAMTRMVGYAVTPPVCSAGALDGIDKSKCELFVPEESISDYMAADQWKEFYSISSSIDAPENLTAGEALDRVLEGSLKVYGLSGRLLRELDRAASVGEALSGLDGGVYVLTGNGQVCKVNKGGK